MIIMELREIKHEKDEAIKHYSEMIKNKLIELCKECGLYDVDVYAKGMRGRIIVEREQLGNNYTLKFYRYTKSGVLSKTATYTGIIIWERDSDEQIKEKLEKMFSLEMD